MISTVVVVVVVSTYSLNGHTLRRSPSLFFSFSLSHLARACVSMIESWGKRLACTVARQHGYTPAKEGGKGGRGEGRKREGGGKEEAVVVVTERRRTCTGKQSYKHRAGVGLQAPHASFFVGRPMCYVFPCRTASAEGNHNSCGGKKRKGSGGEKERKGRKRYGRRLKEEKEEKEEQKEKVT